MSERDRAEAEARRRYESECAGKERHVSKNAAEYVAGTSRAALEAYRCSFCEGWHLAATIRTATRGAVPRPPAFERLRHHRQPDRKHRRGSRHRWNPR